MNSFLKIILTLFTILLFLNCKKGASPINGTDIPSNLQVSATVSTDGSGNVKFSASATNATSFRYEFGNGANQTVAGGDLTYKYITAGTNSYSVVVTAFSSSGGSISKAIQITITIVASPPSLFWSDEFDINGTPDPLKWGYDIGTGSGGWGNGELQYYTSRPENVLIQNGNLKITAIKESFSGSAYTSSRMISKTKFEFTYGKIEVRAKLPAGLGTWPAIWMLGSNISTAGWPSCGEIDIVEHRGSELNKIFGTLHYPGRSGGNADGSTKFISNATTEFHTYAVDWSASSIKIYVDDELYHTVVNSNSIPFNQNFFFLINLAIGGSFGGSVDPAFTSASLEVDYIRVYK